MAEKGYMLRVLKNASFEKMKKAINDVHERSGKSKISIFFDMLWCAKRYGAGYYDYQIFAFYNLKKYVSSSVFLYVKKIRTVVKINFCCVKFSTCTHIFAFLRNVIYSYKIS